MADMAPMIGREILPENNRRGVGVLDHVMATDSGLLTSTLRAVRLVPDAGAMNMGVKMIDRDHAEISDMVLELKLSVMAMKSWSQTGPLMRDLTRATSAHFSLEELMMEATGYPGLTIHKLRHQWMMEQLRTLTARCRKEGYLVDEPLLDLHSESHFAHVQTEDMTYGLWLSASRDEAAD
jgi:hemerythrin-like metal-binding protein